MQPARPVAMDEVPVRDVAREARAVDQQDVETLPGQQHGRGSARAPGSDHDRVVHRVPSFATLTDDGARVTTRGPADRRDRQPGPAQPRDHLRLLAAGRGGRARSGQGANWCTFATWASRQAGATIRGEDALDFLTDRLGGGALLHPLRSSGAGCCGAGCFDSASRLGRLHRPAAHAVRRGRAGRATPSRAATARSSRRSATSSRAGSRPRIPPRSSRACATATRRTASATCAPRSRATRRRSPGPQQLLLANLEIGLHEQTRLQPEICEALDAPYITAEELGRRLCPEPAPADPDGRGAASRRRSRAGSPSSRAS